MIKINRKFLGDFFINASLLFFGGVIFVIAFGCAYGGVGGLLWGLIVAKCVASDPDTFIVFSISLIPFTIGMYLLLYEKFRSKKESND